MTSELWPGELVTLWSPEDVDVDQRLARGRRQPVIGYFDEAFFTFKYDHREGEAPFRAGGWYRPKDTEFDLRSAP